MFKGLGWILLFLGLTLFSLAIWKEQVALRLLFGSADTEGHLTLIEDAGWASTERSRYNLHTASPQTVRLYRLHHRFKGPDGDQSGSTVLTAHEMADLFPTIHPFSTTPVEGTPAKIVYLRNQPDVHQLAHPFSWMSLGMMMAGMTLGLLGGVWAFVNPASERARNQSV